MRQHLKIGVLALAALVGVAILEIGIAGHHSTRARAFGPVVLTSGGGGGGSVKSVSGGSGVTVTNPSSTPSISIDNTIWQSRVTGTCGVGNAVRVVNADGTVTCQVAGGISNGAGANVVMKSNGTNAVASSITDDGTTVAINANKLTVTESNGNTAVAGTLTADNGNRVIDTAGTGLTQTSNSLAVNITGASCTAGNAVTAISATGSGTCTAVGTVTSSTLTSNTIPKATGAGALGNSSATDDGTTFAVNTNKFTVTEASGNGLFAGTLTADSGNRVIDTVGTGLQQTGNSVAVNLTATTCTNGQVVNAISASGVGTCANQNDNNYGSTHLEWTEEFLWPTAANNANAAGEFNIAINGTGAGFTANAGTTTRPGIAESTVGTTTTGNVVFTTSSQAIDFGSYSSTTLEWVGGVPTLSTSAEEYNLIVGYFDANVINQVDGCYFMYDRGNTATAPGTGTISGGDKWECWCAANSVRTGYTMDGAIVSQESFTTVNQAVAALTLPSTNIFHLKLVVTGTTRAEFFVNGTKSCDINTNIPSGSARLTGAGFWIRKSAGTTARLLDSDYLRLSIDLTAARSP